MIASLYRNSIRAGKTLVNAVVNRWHGGWMYDQFLPIQVLNRTCLDYSVTFYGEDEIYQPAFPSDHPCRAFPRLSLHYQPQAIPKPYYFHVPRATLSMDTLIDPANPNREFMEHFPEPTLWPEGKSWEIYATRRARARAHARRGRVEYRTGCLFSHRSWRNYYHFIVDSCLRYVDLDAQGVLPPDMTYFVHTEPAAWQRRYMALLGIDEARVVSSAGGCVGVERFLVASPRKQRFAVSRQAMDSFAGRMRERAAPAEAPPPVNIYISRTGERTRRVLNEDELQETLAEFGFTTLHPRGLSVDEQIRIFSGARNVIASHGAGLANLIYARAPTLIELIPQDRWNYGYFIPMVNMLGGRHVPIMSQAENATEDFYVDVASLRSRLERLEALD